MVHNMAEVIMAHKLDMLNHQTAEQVMDRQGIHPQTQAVIKASTEAHQLIVTLDMVAPLAIAVKHKVDMMTGGDMEHRPPADMVSIQT